MNNPHIRVGDAVVVRRQRWRVVGIRVVSDAHQVITLAGAGSFNGGASLHAVTPFDVIAPARAQSKLRLVSTPRWRRAWRGVLREQAACATPASLRTAATAHIELLPHQLEPALAVLRGHGSRVLIADDVGLGKTIESALIISELRARGAVDRVLVLAPAGVREQWAHELKARFTLDAVVMDTCEGRRRAALLPPGVNPWSTLQVAISSIDYVKRAEVLHALTSVRWDVVVLDEAHGAASGSERHGAAAAICRRAAYVLLLTATPHNGDDHAFRSLCGIGAVHDDPLIVFRRTREQVGISPRRGIHRLHIRPSAEERSMLDAVGALARAVLSQPHLASDGRLALAVLEKRALSSAHSCAESARRRLALLGEGEREQPRQAALPLEADADDLDAADAEPFWSAPLLNDRHHERRLLERVLACALAAVPHQRKVAALIRLLRRLDALGERAIVFTEYRDTLLHLQAELNRPAVLIHGGMPAYERGAAVEAFTNGSARLLLATDAAGEGLNLQAACRVVINLELPWNPVRLEQRIGRVDRIGQTRPVHVFHLIARDSGEVAVLARLQERLANANAQVPVANPLGAPSTPEEQLPALTGLRLVEEAREEYARLCDARAIEPSPGELEGAGTVAPDRQAPAAPNRCILAALDRDILATVAPRRARAALAGRSAAVFRAALLDALGTVVAVRTIALVAASGVSGSRTLAGAAALLRRLAAALSAGGMDGRAAEWRAAAGSIHGAFWSRRAARERAIASLHSQDRHVQRGLFDRRAERLLAESIDERRRFESECDSRVAAAERALQLEDAAAEPVLVLLA